MAVLACSAIVFAAAVGLLRVPPGHASLLAPVVVTFGIAGVALLSLRAHERAEQARTAGSGE